MFRSGSLLWIESRWPSLDQHGLTTLADDFTKRNIKASEMSRCSASVSNSAIVGNEVRSISSRPKSMSWYSSAGNKPPSLPSNNRTEKNILVFMLIRKLGLYGDRFIDLILNLTFKRFGSDRNSIFDRLLAVDDDA